MPSNAPPGADNDSRAPWLSDPGEPEEREYVWEDEWLKSYTRKPE